MYVIVTYDVHAKRVRKALRSCRRYLVHVQRSVFEGFITEAQLKCLKRELKKIVRPESDSVRIYKFESLQFSSQELIGIQIPEDNII